MRYCSSCRSVHLGRVPCGLSWAARIGTVRVDVAVGESRTRRGYFDAESVSEAFGEDARDRALDETDGIGHVERAPDGTLLHIDRHSNELVPLDERRVDDVLLGGATEHDFADDPLSEPP